MSTKTKETLTVISQEEIGRDIYSLWLQTDQMAQNARPGQFLSLYTGDGSKLLPRPISICEIDKEDSKIRLVYRVTGKNTGTEMRFVKGDLRQRLFLPVVQRRCFVH